MCLTPNLVYFNPMLKNKKSKNGLFFYSFTRNNLEFLEESEKYLGGKLYKVPCGNCIECRINKSKEWSIRAFYEFNTSDNAYFITLTYDEIHNPITLINSHFTDFIKKIRNDFRDDDLKIKVFACSEYGEESMRPHFHAIIYNLQLDDLEYSCDMFDSNNQPMLESKYLSSIWNKGLVAVSKVNFETCRYVAGYVDKKLDQADYKQFGLTPPRLFFSKGIGLEYFKKHYKEIYKTDECIYIANNDVKITNPCRYFDRQLAKIDRNYYNYIKEKREFKSRLLFNEFSTDTLDRAKVQSKAKILIKKFEAYNRSNI